MWEILGKNPMMRNLAFDKGLISPEEFELKDQEWVEKRYNFIEKYPDSFWKIEVAKFLQKLRQNVIIKENEHKRKETAMRQNGIQFTERNKHIENTTKIVFNFKAKFFRLVKNVKEWLEPEDIEWVERNGTESFIRNNLEKMQ